MSDDEMICIGDFCILAELCPWYESCVELLNEMEDES